MTYFIHKVCTFCLKNCTFFLILNANSSAVFKFSFYFILNVKCVESASQKDITNVMSIQLHVDIHIHFNFIKYILKPFPLLEIMVIESTCLRVKDLDLEIIETECKFLNYNFVV